MQRPIYIQPSIYIPIEEQIAYNLAYTAKLKEWNESQDNT